MGGRGVAPDRDAAGATRFPWPPPGGGGVVDAFVATWQASVFRPTAFFRAMPGDRNVGAAVGYYLTVGLIAAAVRLFWRLALGGFIAESDSALLRLLQLGEAGGSPLLTLLFTPLILLVSLGISVLIVHFMLWVLGGAHQGMATTTNALAYAYGPQLFVVVPLLGSVVAALWIVALSILGLREAHATTTWRAVLAVLLPVIGLLALFALLAVALLATGADLLL